MKALGIDFGTKTIGLALSDPDQKIAFPFENVPAHLALKRIRQLLVEEGISQIIIGKPTNMKGQPTAMTQQVEAFVTRLSSMVSVPIEYQDERLTSALVGKVFQAHGISSRKSRPLKDAIEASQILQSYLDKKIGTSK